MNRYSFLLIALVAYFVGLPLLEEMPMASGLISRVGFPLVYIGALIANRDKPLIFRIGVGVAVFVIALTCAAQIWRDLGWLQVAEGITAELTLATIAVMILADVLTRYTATLQAVFGAVCVYLIVGLIGASTFRTAELIEESPFAFAHRRVEEAPDGSRRTAFSQLVYFSFVTMTTLGYGDAVPRTTLGQWLTWPLAVFGQLYIAVLVARLVSMLPQVQRE